MKKKIYLTEAELISFIKNIIKEFREKYPELLNPLLEKVGEVGFEGLSNIEQKMLNDISQDSLNTDEIMMMVNRKIASGEELSDVEQIFFDEYAAVPDTSFDDIEMGDHKIDFQYLSTEENPEDDEIVHKGRIFVESEGDEFMEEEVFEGEIYCDGEGNYAACNFENEEGINLFEKYEAYEDFIEQAMEHICNNLKSNLKS
jgi:hypothetical protein